jgi:hypothetical protein
LSSRGAGAPIQEEEAPVPTAAAVDPNVDISPPTAAAVDPSIDITTIKDNKFLIFTITMIRLYTNNSNIQIEKSNNSNVEIFYLFHKNHLSIGI